MVELSRTSSYFGMVQIGFSLGKRSRRPCRLPLGSLESKPTLVLTRYDLVVRLPSGLHIMTRLSSIDGAVGLLTLSKATSGKHEREREVSLKQWLKLI